MIPLLLLLRFLLHVVVATAVAATAPPLPLPSWGGPVPDPRRNASAGLPPLAGAVHRVVYNATTPDGAPNPQGTYNHGPMMVAFKGLFYTSWYNAPRGENMYKRSVFSTSADGGATWSAPRNLFENFTFQGEENGPWTVLGDRNDGTGDPVGRLYTQSGTIDAGLHQEGIQSVARRVGPGAVLGPIFWLNETVPAQFKHLGFPTYLEMDPLTRRDAMQLLASLVRTLVAYPDTINGHGADAAKMAATASRSKMVYNERSLYKVPGTRQVINLLRGGTPKTLSASTCLLDPVPGLPVVTPDRTLFSCRAGVGDAFMNLVEVLELPADAINISSSSSNNNNYNYSRSGSGTNRTVPPHYAPRVCRFTDPVHVSIPDSHSRTCASVLPGGGGSGSGAADAIYLVGNQIDSGRDPVTLAIARDGLHFDEQWAVRWGAPPVRYPGEAKVVGFQYPGAMIWNRTFYISYSIGKEDIGFSQFPVSAVMP